MAGLTLRPDHRLTLLKGGEALFPALVRAIDAARSEVLLETYMFDFFRSVISIMKTVSPITDWLLSMIGLSMNS